MQTKSPVHVGGAAIALMVEGVAQSVNQMLDLLDDLGRQAASPAGEQNARQSNIPTKPSAARALYWLIAPPPPARQEKLQTRGEML